MKHRTKYRTRRILAVMMALIMAFTFYGGATLAWADDADAPDPVVQEEAVDQAEEPALEEEIAEPEDPAPVEEEIAAPEEEIAEEPAEVADPEEEIVAEPEPEQITEEAQNDEVTDPGEGGGTDPVDPGEGGGTDPVDPGEGGGTDPVDPGEGGEGEDPEPVIVDESFAEGVLEIQNVEVVSLGEFQNIYRQSVYAGDAENGEDPEKWYTTEENINLRDPRVFNFAFTVSADQVGEDPEAYLETVKLQYGGHDLNEWGYDENVSGNKNNLRGSNPLFIINDQKILKNTDGNYNVYIAMESKCPWPEKKIHVSSPWYGEYDQVNVPFDEGYYGGRQLNQFSDGQSADNRWWWQIGPAYKGLGEYEMTALAGEKEVASRTMDIQQYDGGNSWIQMNEFAQSLIAAINGEELSKDALDSQITGTVAKGYVKTDENGNFVKGDRADSVYVEVSVLGYGLTDNYLPENKDYNNYSRYNAIWNIAVAQDESKVDKYLNETVPTMNTDPYSLKEKYSAADPEDIDMINVYYQNNVHPDEVTGTDSEIRLIFDLIDGGKEGKKIDYYTWTDDDIEFRYRDPAEGYAQSEDGHQVKGGYEGRFLDTDARTEAVFDTKEALDYFIFVTNICSNPDAKAGMRRTNRYAFDLNRDAVFSTMPETIALIKNIMKWDPLVLNEWHGYVQEMLIEPCTGPHDPAFDADLLYNNMRNLMYAAGEAITANTAYDNFLSPWDHYDAGDWDDGGTIYAPMFAELLGCFGYTIEFPDANSDSFEAGTVINYAMVNELLHGTCDFYGGNRLNGPLMDVNGNMRDGHDVDIIDSSMRKNSVLSKIETKIRGIENIDSMAADKYFIDKKKNSEGKTVDMVVGRARPTDEDGNELSFFPDYIVIPHGEAQYNFAEGIKGINQMIGWNIEVDKTTADVEYKGTVIPAGSYVIPMNQAYRNVIFEVMSKGYDATGFSSMYADIYCNLPDVRGFDSIQVYDKGLFDGKTVPQDEMINKIADIKGDPADYVVFKSQSTDAVRFVNHLFANDANVWMLVENVDGVGTKSDYVIEAKDLALLDTLKDNPVIGIVGCQIEGQYVEELPEVAAPLTDPVIQLNTTRTAQSGGCLWYLLDDYLGFNSLKGYNGSAELREGANVIIANNANNNAFRQSWVDAIKGGQAGVVFIRGAQGLGKLGSTAPGTTSFQDVALNGTYNIDSSLFTENYAKTGTYYARGYAYRNVPEGARILFKSLENGEDAFIGGFQATGGEKTVFGDKVTMFSVTLDGDDFANPVTALAIGQQMDYRSHYQKLLPILATALYAGASGITDVDTDLPEIGELTREGQDYTVTASDARTSVAEMEAYTVAEDGTETLLGTVEGDELGFNFVLEAATKIKVVAKDELGNTQTREFVIEPASSEVIAQAVEEIIDANQSLATGEYTAESVAALQEKIDTLNALIDDQNTTDAELQKAQAELIAAYRQLKPVDKQAQQEAQAVNDAIDNLLKTMIDVYDLDTTPYKPASIDALNEALSNAELALADPESTAADLKAVNTALLTARKEMEKRTPVAGAKFNTIKAFTYNGKAKKPSVTVTLDGTKLVKGTDYTVRYSNNVKAGKATVTITGKGDYIGTAKTTFTINKAKNPITVAVKTAKVKATKVKKANQTLVVTKVLTVKKAQGKVTYVKKSGNKKITINKTTGKVTVKKGLKKGTYKIKVAVKAAGNGNYKAKTVTKTFKIKVS